MSDIFQITYRGMDPSERLEARIRRSAQALERLTGEPIRLRVVIERLSRHFGAMHPVRVGLEVVVPRGRIAVSNDHAEESADAFRGVREAFRSARKSLQHRGLAH